MTNYFLSYDGDAQATIGSAQAAHWYRRMRWRSRAALAGVIALLIAAPLSSGHNPEPSLPSGSYSDPRSGALGGAAAGKYPLFR